MCHWLVVTVGAVVAIHINMLYRLPVSGGRDIIHIFLACIVFLQFLSDKITMYSIVLSNLTAVLLTFLNEVLCCLVTKALYTVLTLDSFLQRMLYRKYVCQWSFGVPNKNILDSYAYTINLQPIGYPRPKPLCDRTSSVSDDSL